MLTIVDFHNKKNFLDKLIIGLAQDRTRSQYSIGYISIFSPIGLPGTEHNGFKGCAYELKRPKF